MRTVDDIDREIAQLLEEKKTIWPKRITVTLERNTDEVSLNEVSEEWGLQFKDSDRFLRTCAEDIDVVIEVEKDGSSWMISIGGSKLEHKIAVN